MRACFYHFMDAEIAASFLTNQIKASFIFFNQTMVIGDTYNRIYCEEIMNHFSARVKVRYMLHHNKAVPQEEWDMAEINLLEELNDMYIKMEKIKHKPPQMLGQLKKMESSIEVIFKDLKEKILTALKEMGFDTLKGIINHPELVLNDLRINKPEEKISKATYSTILSDAIQLKLPSFDGGFDIPVVGEAYFEITFNNTTRFSTSQFGIQSYSKEQNYLQCIFKTIPIANLTINELKLLRNYFEKQNSELNEKIDEWASLFQNTETTPESRKAFINNEIIPIGQSLQTLIDDQEIFKFLNNIKYNSRSYMKVFIGETTIENLWNYYKFIKIIQEETWIKLEKLITENLIDIKKIVPIIGFTIETLDQSFEETNPTYESENVEIKSVKKVISLDDF